MLKEIIEIKKELLEKKIEDDKTQNLINIRNVKLNSLKNLQTELCKCIGDKFYNELVQSYDCNFKIDEYNTARFIIFDLSGKKILSIEHLSNKNIRIYDSLGYGYNNENITINLIAFLICRYYINEENK